MTNIFPSVDRYKDRLFKETEKLISDLQTTEVQMIISDSVEVFHRHGILYSDMQELYTPSELFSLKSGQAVVRGSQIHMDEQSYISTLKTI